MRDVKDSYDKASKGLKRNREKKGKYMQTPDNGNDHRRAEDGPVGIKKHYLNWPGGK